MIKAKIKVTNFPLANFYGPNKAEEAIRFYQNVLTALREMELDGDDNVVICGDFNSPISIY